MVDNELNEMRTEKARSDAVRVRDRLNQGLDNLETELKSLRRVVETMPEDVVLKPVVKHKRVWPWSGISFFSVW